MSAQSTSEEKSLPPTEKKLREARLKGQVSSSQDFVTGLVVATAAIYLWVDGPGLIQRFEEILELQGEPVDAPQIAASGAMFRSLAHLGIGLVLPIVLLAPVTAVVANLIIKHGIPFSIDPITPKLDRIHPAKGFKRIFSLRSLIDFFKSLAKASLLLICLGIAILLGLNAVLQSPSCGIGCVTMAFGAAMRPLIAAATLLFLAAGLIDIGIQRQLFLREMRMTKSEVKREYKETEGEPRLRQARKQRHQEATMTSTRLGVTNATLVVLAPGRLAIGLRFVRDDTPAPVMVARASGADVEALVAEARSAHVTVIEDPALAERVDGEARVGSAIPTSLFEIVATTLVRLGLV